MTTSSVLICNRALGAIAARSTISALNEGTAEANECTNWYDETRQAVLRMHNWGFARRSVVMTLLATAPGVDSQPATGLPWSFMPWSYEYAYPSGALKFRSIVPTVPGQPLVPRPWLNNVPPVRWEISGDLDGSNVPINVVLTDQPSAVGIYTYDATNPDLFDDLFIDALVYKLAANLAMPISGSPGVAKGLEAKSMDAIAQARIADGNEGLRTQGVTPDWIAIRGTSVDGLDRGGAWNSWPYVWPLG